MSRWLQASRNRPKTKDKTYKTYKATPEAPLRAVLSVLSVLSEGKTPEPGHDAPEAEAAAEKPICPLLVPVKVGPPPPVNPSDMLQKWAARQRAKLAEKRRQDREVEQ